MSARRAPGKPDSFACLLSAYQLYFSFLEASDSEVIVFDSFLELSACLQVLQYLPDCATAHR
jgi:hypothetical protein